MSETKTEVSDYLRRWGSLDTEYSSWRTHYKELSQFLLPRTGRFFVEDRNRGDRRHQSIYDSSGSDALDVMSAGLMAGMTSPARPWFRLATSDPDLMKFAPVKVWLADVTRGMLDIFSRSNTYRALHQMYEELGVYGTAASIVLDDVKDGIRHYPLTCGEYRISVDDRGEVNTLYRQFQQQVSQLVAQFGLANCSSNVQSLYKSGSPDAWVTIMHCIEPRSDRDPRRVDALNMRWKSVYVEVGKDGRGEGILRESGWNMFRALVPRWKTTGGDIYGDSPGMKALGDVMQLQHEQLRKGQGIDYMTKPPLQMPTANKNTLVDTLPGGISYVDATSPDAGIRTAFQVNLNLQYLLADIQDVRQRIDRAFYADLFRMLSNSNNDTRMTATEVAERHEEKLLMLGPVLERLHNEMLDPKVEITFARMLESGILPPPPQELHGQDLNIEFVSMLAQAQRAISTNSIDRFVVSLGTVAQFKPNVLDRFDEDKWAEIYSDSLGVDPSLIVGNEQVALVRKQRAEQQQAATQAAMMQQGAETAAAMSKANTGDKNLLTDATAAFSGYQ